jgi:hypothetical protein
VQTSLGENTAIKMALLRDFILGMNVKPLACFSVYIVAATESAKQNK